MKTRVLEGFEISDEAVYAFGDLTAVVTFQEGGIAETYVGATFGDFSDEALLSVLSTGQTLNDVQSWLAYIKPDVALAVASHSKSVVEAVVEEGVETFSGSDRSGKAWIIGFNGESFAFAARDSDDVTHIVAVDDLRIVSDVCITSKRICADAFVVNGPSHEMLSWLWSKLGTTTC